MNTGKKDQVTRPQLLGQIEDLQRRLDEAEQTIEAIRHGDVDAIIVTGPRSEQIYSLTGAEHTYRVIVETMNEAALTTDLDGTILFCNQRFCDLMRTPMHETLGRKVLMFAAEPQQPTLREAMTQAQAGPVRRHLTLRAADGTAVPVLLSAGLLQTVDSVSLCLIASDLTELEESANSIRVLREQRQALEKSEDRYRRFFLDDLTGDFLATPEGELLECNPAFARIYGFESLDAARHCDISTFNPADWLALPELLRAHGRVYNHESWHKRPDGLRIHIVANVVGEFDETGALVAVKGYLFDDTSRKLAEEALEETNFRLRCKTEDLIVANEQLLTQQDELQRQTLVLEEMKDQAQGTAEQMEWLARLPMENPNPVFRVATDGRILYRNPAAADLCRLWDADFGSRVPPSVREIIQAASAARHTIQVEKAFGQRIYLFTATFIREGEYVNVYIGDITDRKQTEEALRASDQRLRLAHEAARLGAFEWDIAANVNRWTAELEAMHGLAPGGFGGTQEAWEQLVHPEDREEVVRQVAQAFEMGLPTEGEWRIVWPDGSVHWIAGRWQVFKDASGRPVRMSGINLDITERKGAEEALRESEEKYRVLFESMNEGFVLAKVLVDEAGRPCDILNIEVNQAAAESVGLRPEQMVNRRYTELFPQADQGAIALCAEVASSGVAKHFERRGRNTGRWYDCYSYSPRKGYVAILTVDITERRQAEEALRESEERYRTLFESMDEGFCIIEMLFDESGAPVDYRFLQMNPAFIRHTGLRDAEGKRVRELVPNHEAHWFETYGTVALTGEPTRFENWSQGLNRWYDVYAFRVGDPQERHVAILFNDITERKHVEEQIRELNTELEERVARRTAELEYRTRQLQKLALELSQAEDRERRRIAEILHDDLQQQIAAAKFHVSLIGSRAKGDPAVQKATAKVDEMLRDAVEKSRGLSHELSPAILQHGTLAEALGWLAGQMQTKHGLTVHVEADGNVDTDSEALKTFLYRAAQELLFNAIKHARTNEAAIRLRRLGRCLCLSVSDKGRGFDPTTLKAAKGFGLLSIRERIELMGGRMRIKSAEGRGSTFFITIGDNRMMEEGGLTIEDRRQRTVDGLRPSSALRSPSSGRILRVLLVDDHEIMRDGLASLFAEEDDVEVVGEASDGREAVNQAYRLQPDVIVMDVAMPLMNGDEAAEQIKRHLPETRIIGLSMFHEKEAEERMRRAGAEGFVLKTAPSEQLLKAIRGKAGETS